MSHCAMRKADSEIPSVHPLCCLPINISELTLKGIYLQAKTGYWAIFTVGGEYDWYQVGTKFRDGDLVNITDGAVVFKHYVSDDATQVREVIKELHRGEE